MAHVEWQEIRGGEAFFIEADKTTVTWAFSERSSFEVRWFSVPPKAGWIEKAERLAQTASRNTNRNDYHDGESSESTAAPDVEVGDFYDNASVLAVANWKINTGTVREGLAMLAVLHAHIVGMPDPKSRWILLPAVDKAIRLAHLKQVESRREAEEVALQEPQSQAVRSRVMASDGHKLNRSPSHDSSEFKLRLIDAVGLVTALSWTYSLLVHEIMTLPGLAASPTGANVAAGSVVAGSVLAVVLRFFLRGRG